jgi:hypothetical protein
MMPDDVKEEMMQYIERYAPLEMVAQMKADPSLENVVKIHKQLLPDIQVIGIRPATSQDKPGIPGKTMAI